jgi:hypothetical protein
MTTVFGVKRQAALGLGVLILMTGALWAQESATPQHIGVPEDWSTRRVIYTGNGSAEDMSKVIHDPRFMHGTLLRYLREHGNQTRQLLTSLSNEPGSNEPGSNKSGLSENITPDLRSHRPTPLARNKHSKVDWSVSLGPTAGLAMGETPSVYTYNYAVPSCSNLSATPPTIGDFVVYTINAAPSVGTQANLVGLTNLYTTGDGSGFCSGTGPTFLFSYAIGTGGSPLSPVLSADGSKIAWIENRTATDAYLHVTIWVANQGTTAVWPAAVNGTFANGSCTPAGSSCDIAIEYTNATYPGCPTAYKAGNGHSDLYVDYTGDSGFISANNGLLYHIKNIFSKTTSPTIDFCTPVNPAFETAPSSAMSGTLYDPLLNKLFITDSETIYAYTVNASSFSAPSPASYKFGNTGSNFNYQSGPGPLMDVFNNYLYVFSTYDANGNTSVTQIPTSLASATAVQLGNRSTNANHILFYGAFDNNYYTNGPKSAASTLYGCGTGSSNNSQSLYAISFNAATGLMNSTPAMSNNRNVNLGGNSNGVCSPITELYDGTTDRIFVGMGQPGANTGANVVTMWNVTNQLTNTSGPGGTMPTYTAQATNYLGGTSGIAADNIAGGTAQAESIYFSTENVGATATAVAGNGYNVNGIYSDGTTFATGGLDNDGNAYSSNLLGTSLTWNGITFTFGPANALDAWANTTITLPSGQFNTLTILAAAVNSQTGTGPETFTVHYTDGTTTTLSQTISDWFVPLGFTGESVAKTMAYRDVSDGSKDNRTFDLFGYSFAINPNKTVSSLTLPATRNVVVLAAAMASNCGGRDYCAVKLTQSGLQ